MAKRGEAQAFIAMAAAMAHGPTDPCVLWPDGWAMHRNGYGAVTWRGRMRTAHAAVLELREGPAPDGRSAALHVAGLGCDRRCLIHVRWGSQAENMADTVTDGTSTRGARHANSRLTADQVLAIRRAAVAGISTIALAQTFGVARQTIRHVIARRTWGWL